MAYDPDFQQAATRTFERLGIPPDRPTPRFPRGDVVSRRQGAVFLKAVLALNPQTYPHIEKTEYKVVCHDGAEISVLAFRRKSDQRSSPEPAVLYLHGGGMIFGSAELFEPLTRAEVAATGVAHFSVYSPPIS